MNAISLSSPQGQKAQQNLENLEKDLKLTDFVAVPRAAWSEGEGADREAADELRGVPAVLRVGEAATRGQRPG